MTNRGMSVDHLIAEKAQGSRPVLRTNAPPGLTHLLACQYIGTGCSRNYSQARRQECSPEGAFVRSPMRKRRVPMCLLDNEPGHHARREWSTIGLATLL